MPFFKRKLKRFARNNSYYALKEGYEASDRALERASVQGDQKGLKAAMKEHRQYEYALLYRNTPEFRKSRNKLQGR